MELAALKKKVIEELNQGHLFPPHTAPEGKQQSPDIRWPFDVPVSWHIELVVRITNKYCATCGLPDHLNGSIALIR